MNFIAIDIGSTFIKAAVYDLEKEIILWQESYRTPEKRILENHRHFEVNAIEFVVSVKEIIQEIYGAVGACQGILFSTQQHGCVLEHPDMKEDTYISWQDTRCMDINPRSGRSYLEDIEELLPKTVMEGTGVPVKPALAMCNLYTLFQENDLAKTPNAKIYTLGSYVISVLTGNNICHITNAAPMGFADILKQTWRMDILEKLGLDFFVLPEITGGMNCSGYYKNGDINLPVYTDVGDVQVCTYGTGADTGDLVVHIGTSGQLVYISDEYSYGDYETRPYFDGKYCRVISRMPGGRNFDVQIGYIQEIGEKIFGKKLSKEEIWDKVHKLDNVEDLDGLSVDCGFYELPNGNGDGNISHINHTNFQIANVIKATAVDFGAKYRYFADTLFDRNYFDGTLYYAGGAALKNQMLQNEISLAIGFEKIVSTNENEVYVGMLKLALKCVESEG